jgi:hypothetical protein
VKKVIIVLAVMLSGCYPSARELDFPVVPEGLSDCKFYRLSSAVDYVTVVRCPNSSTSTNWRAGKATRSAVVVE